MYHFYTVLGLIGLLSNMKNIEQHLILKVYIAYVIIDFINLFYFFQYNWNCMKKNRRYHKFESFL